jgi:hypothetical protein
MNLKRNLVRATLIGACLVCLTTINARSQVTVITEPVGAKVALIGEIEVHGVAPTTFFQALSGKYRVTVSLTGYDTRHESIEIHPLRPETLTVKLSPKTGFKGAVRSLFVPGWGQRYGGQKAKAWAMHLLAAGSIAGYLIADHNFDIKYNKFLARRDDYDAAVERGAGRPELEALLADLTDAQEDAFDHEDYRRVAIGAVVGVWAVSVLDALLFFPDERGGLGVGDVRLQPQTSVDQVGLQLSYRF